MPDPIEHPDSNVPAVPDRISPDRLPHSRALLAITVPLLCGLALVGFLDRTAATEYLGMIDSRTTIIRATTAGRVTRILAGEGDLIEQATGIVELTDERLADRIVVQRRDIERLRTELELLQAQAELDLRWRLRDLDGEILETRLESTRQLEQQFAHEFTESAWNEIALGPSAVGSGRDSVYEELLRPLVIESHSEREAAIRALIQREHARNEAETHSARVALCEQRLQELARLRQELPTVVRQAAGVDAGQHRLEVAKEQLASLLELDDATTLTSGVYGQVTQIMIRQGQEVLPGTPVAEVTDDTVRNVVVRIPSADLYRIAIGGKVDVVFPGDVQRTGVIRQIAARVPSQDAAPAEVAIPVRIAQRGKLWPTIPVGATVRVRIPNGPREPARGR